MCEIESEKVITGESIETFFEEVSRRKYDKCKFYFHNLKFDGMFIVYHLLAKLKYPYCDKLVNGSFNSVISSLGQWYEVKIRFENGYTITISDSLKKIPFSVSEIARDYHLEVTKGEIDYKKFRGEDYRATREEVDYIHRDVIIMAQALKLQFAQGLTRMTIGSDAFNGFKQTIEDYRALFPELAPNVHAFIKNSYKGGFVYVNPIYQNVMLSNGCVFDVVSMYPWAMYSTPAPFGKPVRFSGGYIFDEDYPLYVVKIIADFKLKVGHVPMIQIKKSPYFKGTEYVTDSKGPIELTLTSVDLKLFLEQYDILDEIQYIGGYKFRAKVGLFSIYIDKWLKIKNTSTGSIRANAKLMLNSLYGKFAKNPDITGKIPIYDEEHDKIKFKRGKDETVASEYIPVAAFITSYSREKLITAIQSNYDNFVYCDTDSLHIVGDDISGLTIGKNLGEWEHERSFKRAKYLHAKCYLYEYDKDGENAYKPTIAGMPKSLHEKINFDNFKVGARFDGKLLQKSISGGVILADTTFEIGAI